MGHFSDDFNNDEFMNASAEEWSKPSPPPERPAIKPEPTDRWGSPIPDPTASNDASRWGSEPVQRAGTPQGTNSGGSNWWVILIVALVMLCLCICAIIGLVILGVFSLLTH